MVVIGALRKRAKNCLRMLHKPPSAPRPTTPMVDLNDPTLTPFLCNVCGSPNALPRGRLTREDGRCAACGCYGRLRAMMYAVTARFSPDELVLGRMKPRKDIRGVGCSDWGYPKFLAEKFDYVNTFYDHEPKLDICNADAAIWPPESLDFITCTDVLEHIEPPVDRAFVGMRRLLKPGGAIILTVPTTLSPETREHFPDLHQWRIETVGEQRVVVNRRRDGRIERYDNLCFHGGGGFTLEFRVFSRQGLIDTVERSGLRIAAIYDQPISAYAVPLCEYNFVLVAEKPEST